jgi:hypothetical protein
MAQSLTHVSVFRFKNSKGPPDAAVTYIRHHPKRNLKQKNKITILKQKYLFLPLVFPSLGVFQPCWFFQMPLPSFVSWRALCCLGPFLRGFIFC